jgi:predicted Zn-dependent protease
MLRALSALLCSLLVAGCATVPGTERSQLVLVPRSVADDMGRSAWTETLNTAAVIPSGEEAAMVQRVGERIVAAAGRIYPERSEGYEWEFALIDEPQTANAWALPGGKSAVYSGLLPMTQTEDGLAAVMGHEVCHVLAKHGAERMTHTLMFNLGMSVAQIASQQMGPAEQDAMLQTLGMVGQAGAILPFSRTHESEADHMGLMLAADAGYDPRAAVELWKRMGAGGGERPPEFLSTHPSEETRIAKLTELMPKAMVLYKQAVAAGR